jgi:polyhydroxyalkanoate synthesis regulator phasin
MQIFGFNITRTEKPQTEKSFVAPTDDGSVESIRAGGYYGTYLDLEGVASSEAELIKRYRDISMHADVDSAIEDICNDSISNLEDEEPVKLNLDRVEMSPAVKKQIHKEFENIVELLDFRSRAQDYFRRWYIDGRIFFHKVIDTEKPRDGIKDIRYIDPRKITKVREVKKEKNPQSGVNFIKKVEEYFLYNDKGLSSKPGQYKAGEQSQALKVTKDAIVFAPSGLIDQDKNIPLSYLHKAIRPANQLRMMENAVVIYRITRAPERRIFYVDVGNLPAIKAEQYLKDIMDRYRNKLVYDASTGEIRDDKKFMSMLEDFWLPRREGGTGTQIDTLPAGQNLGQIEDVEYFQKKLYQALNVPISRLQEQGGLNFGRAAEINRDELKFTKFISKLRKRFSVMFDDLLRTQLVLKGVITEDDWKHMKDDLLYEFASDAYYTESKDQEILRSRIEVLNGVSAFIGTLFSKRYVQKEILRLTDDEIDEMENEIALEPQLQRQYQWSPFSPVDGGDPEGQPQEGEQGVENG